MSDSLPLSRSLSLQGVYSQVIKPTHHHEQINVNVSRNEMVFGSKGFPVDQRRVTNLGRPSEDNKVALISTSGLLWIVLVGFDME